MPTNLTGSVQIVAQGIYESLLDLSTPKDSLALNIAQAFAAGVGDDQINKLWHDQRTLTGATSEDLDLAGGITDAFGNVLTFTYVKALIIQNLDAAKILTIGNAASHAWSAPFGAGTHTVNIGPGGVLVLVRPNAGYAVGAGATDVLKIASDGTCIYNIVVMGI